MADRNDAFRFLEQLGEDYGRRLAQSLRAKANTVVPAVALPRKRRVLAVKRVRASPRARAVRPIARNANVVAGAVVHYRQGRGTFPAEVVRVDEVTGIATLQRTADGKRVLRPVDRIYL